jgi:hypothetical protein
MALVKYNNNSISDITTTALATGSLVPIKTLTASSSATLSFVHGTDGVILDSTYPIYKFEYINIHPQTQSNFSFQVDTGTNTNYNQTITSSSFYAEHSEGDSSSLSYFASTDQAQGTGFQMISHNPGTDNDSNSNGTLTIFNPSSSTFVKHFIGDSNCTNGSATSHRNFVAGYINTTTALTRVQFKFASDNIDSGKIKLYGIKDS